MRFTRTTSTSQPAPRAPKRQCNTNTAVLPSGEQRLETRHRPPVDVKFLVPRRADRGGPRGSLEKDAGRGQALGQAEPRRPDTLALLTFTRDSPSDAAGFHVNYFVTALN